MNAFPVDRLDTPDWLDKGGRKDGGGIKTESGVAGPGKGDGEF